MTTISLACNVQGDYGYKIITVDREDTIANLIKSAVESVEGYLVAAFPANTEFDAKVHGADSNLDHSSTINATELIAMEVIDISVRDKA